MKKEDLVDLKTTHKGLTVRKYKESNLGPVAGFRALIIISKFSAPTIAFLAF